MSTILEFTSVVSSIFIIKLGYDKKMLKRRKESGTYLATDIRHRWRVQMMKKNDNKMTLSAGTAAFIS